MEDNEHIEPADVPETPTEADDTTDPADVLIPIEQHTILFYGKPIVVVRLPDGRPAVVMRYLCDNMLLDRGSQIRRIQRTKAITRDLVYCLVETSSGMQKMPTLILRSLPYWLLGVDPGRARPEMQAEILRYQEEAVDILYAWAQAPRALPGPAHLVPTVIPSKPVTEPGPSATPAELASYHEAMAIWHRALADRHMQQWRSEMNDWRGSVEARLEGDKAMTDLIPEILERLPPQTLTPTQQQHVRTYVKVLSEKTGKPYATIWEEFKMVFEVARYQDTPQEDWDKVVNWFQVQIERARGKR